MRKQIETFDWSTTAIGAPDSWAQSMKTVLSIALNTSFAMMIMWGPELIQLYNEGYVPILGDKHPRSLGQPAAECWADIWESVGPMLRGVYERAEPVYYENLPLKMQRHGRYEDAYFTFSYSPVFEGATVGGIICVVNETTAYVLRERETAERATALTELDRAKTEFFSNVSHEFRTPLTLMLGPLDELRSNADESSRALLDMTKRNALRLLKLVNTLLEFSRIEAGRVEAHYQWTDLAAFTTDLANVFRPAIEGGGLEFIVAVAPVGNISLDRNMWERIVFNLLSNALNFTIRGRIVIELAAIDSGVQLRVSDTGSGIAQDELHHVFERFQRSRAVEARSHEGSGIGLALVQELVRLHNGRIEVESELGLGTAFCVTMPGKDSVSDDGEAVAYGDAFDATPPLAAQYLAEVAAAVPLATTSVNAVSGSVGAYGCILLADDNADLRAYVSRILSKRHEVVVAENGVEALTLARERRFDLIISDVMMPELDGFDLLDAIRSDTVLSGTPFIMLSARAGEEAAVDALAHGADDYLTKPFSAEELLGRVHAHLNAATIREKGVRALRASEERFRALTASMPHTVIEGDGMGSLTYVSEVFTKYTGCPSESALGSGWTRLMHPDDVPAVLAQWQHSMQTGDPFVKEFRYCRADGAYRWHVAHALAQRDRAGLVFRWTGTVTDIHETRRAVEEREFLSLASRLLAESLELQTTLQNVALLTVPRYADWCQIDLRSSNGSIQTMVIAHRDPRKNELAQQFIGLVHLNIDADHGSPAVIRTGKSDLVETVSAALIADAVADDSEIRLYRELGVSSVACVPLCAQVKTLGAISVVYGDAERRYRQDDLPMLEELGRRAGLAIQNASDFEREHRVADSFQQASLPLTLPDVPGLTFDAIYAPGSNEAQVGGDWYDAVRLLDGRIVVSIGDVLGSGLSAAVTMGNVRQIIRGIAQVHADPALMLDSADRALRLEHPDTFVTAFVAVLDPIAKTLAYASAGHPPPLLRHADGRIDALTDGGLPLGLRDFRDSPVGKSTDVTDGATLVLYTDGLTESLRDPVEGEARLRALLADESLIASRQPAQSIKQAFLDGSHATDDVAILTIRIGSASRSTDAVSPAVQHWAFDVLDADAAQNARREFRTALLDKHIDIESTHAAELVFGELVGNVVRYAPGSVKVSVDWSSVLPVLHVIDDGPGFRHLAILPNDVYSESGRGLYLVSTLTHDFQVSKRPNGGSHARAVLSFDRKFGQRRL